MFKALKAGSSPFTELQIQQLQSGLGGLDAAQTAWLSGFIAGRLAAQAEALPSVGVPAAATPEPLANGKPLQVFFASQTGNGEEIARELGREAQRAGLTVEVQSLSSLRPPALKKLEHAAFVISTHGEGDPPDDALDLFEYLASPRAGRLENLKFRVLALGDRSYSQFCAAGRKLESLLLTQGAATFAERIECDVDFQPAAATWATEVVNFGRENLAFKEPVLAANALPAAARLSIVPQTSRWSRANPFAATVER
ncbi:MAG: flavodoxin domain-containing protein, partial [Lysobacterales bacterium]